MTATRDACSPNAYGDDPGDVNTFYLKLRTKIALEPRCEGVHFILDPTAVNFDDTGLSHWISPLVIRSSLIGGCSSIHRKALS
jgi:hypothetical protein